MKLSLVLITASTLLVTAHASAEQACVDIATVQVSAIPAFNTEYGGHLTVHIYDMAPPRGQTQNGKTLFSSKKDYGDAWDDLRRQERQINCAVHPRVGAEAARDTDTRLHSRQCTAAHRNGTCTAYHQVQTNGTTFLFRAVEKDRKVIWILYTAYPWRR